MLRVYGRLDAKDADRYEGGVVSGYIQMHRLVMEKALSRILEENEVVHHKNDNKLDNRLENLELFGSNGEHLHESLAGKCPQWSAEGWAKLNSSHEARRDSEPINSRNHRKNVVRDLDGILYDADFPDYLLSLQKKGLHSQ
jgi:hypothetical protein